MASLPLAAPDRLRGPHPGHVCVQQRAASLAPAPRAGHRRRHRREPRHRRRRGAPRALARLGNMVTQCERRSWLSLH